MEKKTANLGGSPTHLAGSVTFLPSRYRPPHTRRTVFCQKNELSSEPLRTVESGGSEFGPLFRASVSPLETTPLTRGGKKIKGRALLRRAACASLWQCSAAQRSSLA